MVLQWHRLRYLRSDIMFTDMLTDGDEQSGIQGAFCHANGPDADI